VTPLADELLELTFAADPVMATLVGAPGRSEAYATLLADRSAAGEQTMRARLTDVIARAGAMDSAQLSADDKVTRAVVLDHARSMIDLIDARDVEYVVTDLFIGPASDLLTMLPMIALPDADAGRAYLARLREIPRYLDQVAERLRFGAAAGRVPVARLVDASVAQLGRYLADPANDAFARQELAGDLGQEREQVLADIVRPAFAKYRSTLVDEIAAHGRGDDKPGVCWLPDGEETYGLLSRVHTTTDRTPDELHQTGLDVVARLADEYRELGSRVFGTSDLAEIFRRMTSDPELRWRDGDELLTSAREAVTRAEDAAPAWFGRLASTQCKVEPVAENDAPSAPAAYYMWPSMDGQRPGIYFANSYKAHERDRFVSEVLAFHEAVPGHHFQLAIAQELTHLPLLRRVVGPNAYVEGWGLYSERLADEMGLYSSDMFRLGMLAMDSLRAGRLVVDTGLHAKGWSREQAVTFLRDNSPMADLEINNEIDRYIGYAGQALSYMVGRLEIQRIRAAAEQALGSRFDISAFHDVVLGSGSLALSVLDGVVTDWTSEVANRP
jgi:uncharacterized protein (DUF885 family)